MCLWLRQRNESFLRWRSTASRWRSYQYACSRTEFAEMQSNLVQWARTHQLFKLILFIFARRNDGALHIGELLTTNYYYHRYRWCHWSRVNPIHYSTHWIHVNNLETFRSIIHIDFGPQSLRGWAVEQFDYNFKFMYYDYGWKATSQLLFFPFSLINCFEINFNCIRNDVIVFSS